ncbi:MAG: hypothetical protein QOE70_5101 [Chthoniobacter sp.]|jgi:hypothetical protein|nr:hypothetical protein [Chthoniobacter sp.]
MRVAICFFGITRNLQNQTLRAFETKLFAPCAKLDPHFVRFGHFNLPRQISNPRSKERELALSLDDYRRIGCDESAATPQEEVDEQIDLASFQKHGDPWGDGFTSTRNLLRQYYSLEQVTRLLQQSKETFDVVIYSRADVLYRRRLTIPAVAQGVIYTPGFARWGGLNDRFALGDQPAMVKYGLRGKSALEYVETTGRPLHAEQFLHWYADQQGLRNQDLDVRFWRVRADGRIAPLDGHLRVLYTVYGYLQRFARRHRRP